MPLTLHAEIRGSNPLGSTDKLPANDEEIENSSRHAEDAVQQPCHNPSESFELLDKLIARKMPICGKPIPCGDFMAWEHLVAPRDGLCFMLSLALRRNLPLLLRRRPRILQRPACPAGDLVPSKTSWNPVNITSLKFCGARTSML